MSRRQQQSVLAGFTVGSGEPVRVPLAHTFVTGQTQLSGKTTTLRALVMRSGKRALAFVTKRGEDLDGRRIPPYLPREGDRPIHWRMVETILASALGQRSMKYERYWIVNAAKGAKSLEHVRQNVRRLLAKAKGSTAETYELIGEYLDLVLPEMQELAASSTLDLQPGLNVIDLAGHSQQLQAMVIRACLEHINQREHEVLTVFPEAWEFAPRGRTTPASAEAIAMARKGAVLGNFLLCDSQDIAGVDTVVRQAASVWILGVQRELNELKRTLQMIPAGIRRPKVDDITSLKVGQFIICWQDNAVRTYVQPAWMDEADAIAIARGKRSIDDAARPTPAAMKEPTTPQPEEDEMSKEDIAAMRQDLNNLTSAIHQLVAVPSQAKTASPPAPTASAKRNSSDAGGYINGQFADDEERRYQAFVSRLQTEAPKLLNVAAAVPELRVTEELKTIEASTSGKGALMGRIALLVADGFFDEPKADGAIRDELKRYGLVAQKSYANVTYSMNLKNLVDWGFLYVESSGYQANPRMKKHIKRV